MNNTIDIEENPYDYYENILGLYYASYMWVLAVFGVPGNVACIFTVATMTLTTSTFYVVLLAAADLAALVLKLIFHQIGYHQMSANTFLCKGDVFVQMVSCYANWTLVLICFDRFLTVCCYPKRNNYFTTIRAILVAILLGVILCLCFLYGFIEMDKTEEGHCDFPEYAHEFAKSYWYWITATIYFFLPFILLSIFTGRIIVSLRRQRKAREALGATTQSTSRETNQPRVEQTICIMMVWVAIVFLLLTLPTCIYHLMLIWKTLKAETTEQWFAWAMFQLIAGSLSEANHAVNFYIYFISAKRFRSRFKALIMRYFSFGRRTTDSSGTFEDDTFTQHSLLHENTDNETNV